MSSDVTTLLTLTIAGLWRPEDVLFPGTLSGALLVLTLHPAAYQASWLLSFWTILLSPAHYTGTELTSVCCCIQPFTCVLRVELGLSGLGD